MTTKKVIKLTGTEYSKCNLIQPGDDVYIRDAFGPLKETVHVRPKSIEHVNEIRERLEPALFTWDGYGVSITNPEPLIKHRCRNSCSRFYISVLTNRKVNYIQEYGSLASDDDWEVAQSLLLNQKGKVIEIEWSKKGWGNVYVEFLEKYMTEFLNNPEVKKVLEKVGPECTESWELAKRTESEEEREALRRGWAKMFRPDDRRGRVY